jgi:hypothetical protein
MTPEQRHVIDAIVHAPGDHSVVGDAIAALVAERDAARAEVARLRNAIIDYQSGIRLLDPALSAALAAHLPALQGGDSEY